MGKPSLSLDKVNDMFLAYLERQTAEYVRNKCGISWNTAKKYVEHGDPGRGVESFKQRLRRVSKLSQRTFEERVAFSKGVGMANLWEQLADLDDLITASVDHLKSQMAAGTGKVRLTDIVKAIQLSADLKMRLAKRVEQTRTVTEVVTEAPHHSQPEPSEDDIGQFTPQELHSYINSDGKVVPAWFAGATAALPGQPADATPAKVGSSEPQPPHSQGGDSRPESPVTPSIAQDGTVPHPDVERPTLPAKRCDSTAPAPTPPDATTASQEQSQAGSQKQPQGDAQDAQGEPAQEEAKGRPQAGELADSPTGAKEDTGLAPLAEGEPAPSEIPAGAESWSEDGLDFPTWTPPAAPEEDTQ